MEIKPSYNPESSTFFLEISSNLLESYFNNLRGMLLDKNEFKNLEVTKKGYDTALITFTVPKEDLPINKERAIPSSISEMLKSDLPDSIKNMISELSADLNEGDVSVVAIPLDDTTNPIGKMNQLINDFINSAIRHKMRTTEFVPLINYPYDKLREDIIAAIKAKRNICLVDDYENYLKSTENKLLEFNQYYIDYINSDYADVAILVNSGKIEEFKKTFSPKLKKISWI